jgi:hypothetical protein
VKAEYKEDSVNPRGMELLQGDMEFLQEVLRVTEDDFSIRVTGIEVSRCCKDGENYMAIVSRVTIRGDRDPDRKGMCTCETVDTDRVTVRWCRWCPLKLPTQNARYHAYDRRTLRRNTQRTSVASCS